MPQVTSSTAVFGINSCMTWALFGEAEPFRKLVNQGMIQGRSSFVYRVKDTNKFVSFNLKDQYEVSPIHVDISLVKNDVLDTEAFKALET